MNVLRSPRWRRRLGWSLGALAVVGGVTAIALLYPNRAERASEEALGREQAKIYTPPKHIELTREQRAHLLATAANFVTHAVARHGVEQAYDLTAPSLRGGLTRSQWRSGEIPVVPFPVKEARWKLEFSDEDAIGLQVLLFPRARSGLKPELFNMELAARGNGERFLVTSWSPSGVASSPTPAQGSVGVGGVPNLGDSFDGQAQARLGSHWLLAPLVLFALVPLVVIGFFTRGWLRGRRAAAEYATSGSARELPTIRR